MNKDIKSKSIKTPIFVIEDDNTTVIFLNELWDLNYCGMEAIDVANGIYTAYDSEGQVLKLVTVDDETGEVAPIEKTLFRLPFLGKITTVNHNMGIGVIAEGVKVPDKLRSYLIRDLVSLMKDLIAHKDQFQDLTLPELVSIYQKKYPKIDLGDG
jgi:hypothetical protein